jgi:hypothetical protein
MKHVGKMKNNSAKVAVAYRTLPKDSLSALVIGTNGLPDSHHDALMSLIESDAGQQANELADVLATRRFPDGSVMLSYLHLNGHLTKVKTAMVLMTPNRITQLPLDQLNELIAKDKGVPVDDLAVKEESSSNQKKTASTTDNDASKVSFEESTYHPSHEDELVKKEKPVTASDLRSMADKLFKEAQALRKKAEELEPTRKKAKKTDE